MNLRRQHPKDSLDLLLDTMCNAFGGIILLAVLVALLARQHPNSTGNSPDSSEMLARRIAQAEQTLGQTRTFITELARQATNPAIQQRVGLLSQRRALQDQIALLRSEADLERKHQSDETSSADPAKRLLELKAQLAQSMADRVSASNSLTTVVKENQRLRERLFDVRRQMVAAQEEVTQRLRLPKERNTGKDVFNIIVQHGRIFPLRNADNERNRTSLTWQETAQSVTPIPIPGKGLDPRHDSRTLKELFNALPRQNFYIAFYVFEDSFAAFNEAKRIAVSSGLDYGWMPLETKEAPISFGAIGTRPKAQ
jgi:hypothetical protein